MWPLNIRLGPPPAPVERAEHVGAAVLDLLPGDLQPARPRARRAISSPIACSEPVKLGVLDRTRRRRRPGAPRRSATRSSFMGGAISARWAAPSRRTARSARSRSSPHSSSMTWVQPASRYSSIAAMQSSGVPAIGLQRSSSASVTAAFAARRPPRSIASATGASSAIAMPGELEQRVGRALDVLELVGEVHAGDLARAVAPGVAVAGVDRGDDRAADVELVGVAPVCAAPRREVLAACSGRRPAS